MDSQRALDRLAIALADRADERDGRRELRLARIDPNLISLAGCSLGTKPGVNNWVEQEGGLPEYICEIARSIHREKGMPVGRAISIAVGRVKGWCRGEGKTNADTKAKACAAAASWEKKKASARARPNKS